MGKRAFRGIIVSVILLVGIGGMFAPAGGHRVVDVRIEKGKSAGEIGRILEEAGVIRSARVFSILARLAGKGTELKPGEYKFSPMMTPWGVMLKIARGETCAQWVSIPEGFTIRQIAERLEAEGLCDAKRFIKLAHSGARFRTTYSHPAGSLEGYLFPDTYLIPKGATEEEIIEQMLECFGRKVVMRLGARISASGMSLHQIVTLASLIEREAKVARDRPLISAVLHNRLRRGILLECDATVLYALGRHKNRVFYKDLEVDSPYNTYRRTGLPPGPIANPGFGAIEAALEPAQVDYLYYVARPEGSHIFSRTFDEHKAACRAVRMIKSR